ncbi:fungal-specific transcription factor domain-containing protein [Ilyonectria sp. MPI-CAGE-AT-0026]|nr:fungal-specific transcription factor domain-containing protein [Ilyonectria sp. MPI-CAGE-AT-0026]
MNHTSRPLTKRPRAAIACNGCRQTKAKCDSERPICGRCAKDEIECVYTQDGRKKRVNRRRVESDLKLRVQGLEARLALASCPPDGGHQVMGPRSNTSPALDVSNKPEEETSPIQSNSGVSATDSLYAQSHTESLPDVRATGVFDPLPATDIGYFGPSSNHALFRSISAGIMNLGYNTARRHLEPVWPDQIRGQETYQTPRGSQSSYQLSNTPTDAGTGLPERRVALELAARFFDAVGAILPYTNESIVMKEIHRLCGQVGDGISSSPDIRALLNIVFAHALLAVNEPSSELFYSRAFSLLENESQHMSTLESLQACILLVSFQQNSRRAITSWTTHCLAVKMCYQLGVHAPLTYEGLTVEEKQLRAKLWLGVVTQDRILSSALGRPSLIPQNHVQKNIVKMLDPPYHAGQPGPILLKEAYFQSLISLHEITGSAVDEVYNFNISASNDIDFDEVAAKTFDLSRRIDRWRQSCQPFKIPNRDLKSYTTSMGMGARKYEALLSIHYYRTVLLVNGPLLSSVLERSALCHSDDSDVLQDVSVSMLRRDFAATKELSGMLSFISRGNPAFFGCNAIWWMCNYGALTLCLHLLGFWMILFNACGTVSSLGIKGSEVEALLQDTLDTFKIIGGSSIMSSKAHICMRQYVDFLAFIANRTPVDDLRNLDQVLSVCEHSNSSLIHDTNLDDIFQSLESDDALFSGLLGSENWTSDLHDIGLI